MRNRILFENIFYGKIICFLLVAMISVNAFAANGITYTYDALNRVKTITKPDSLVFTNEYLDNTNQVKTTDERGNVTDYYYESFSNPDEKRLVTVNNGATVGSTDYVYTAIGNISSVTLSGGITHSFGYNSKQFLETEKHPEMDVIPEDPSSACVRYTHYNNGDVHTKKDARGTITYDYDTINRLSHINYSDGTPTVTYTYYKNDCVNTVGSTPTLYTFTYYDDRKLNTKTYSIDGHSYSMSYTYNNARNLSTITYPSGRVITYNYYSDNMYVSSVRDSLLNRNLAYNIKYQPNGKLNLVTYGNGKTTRITPDTTYPYRTSSISAGSIFSQQYGYDKSDNVTSIVDTRNNASFTISMNADGYTGYNSLNRLMHVKGPWGTLRYDYDYSGNRTSMTFDSGSVSYSINSTRNRLDSYTATLPTGPVTHNFYYDASGNINEHELGEGDQYTYSFDQANRLKHIDLLPSSGGIRPVYTNVFDAVGNRIKMTDHDTSGDVNKIYHYGLSNEVLSETKTDGTPQVDYIYLGGKLLSKYAWPNP